MVGVAEYAEPVQVAVSVCVAEPLIDEPVWIAIVTVRPVSQAPVIAGVAVVTVLLAVGAVIETVGAVVSTVMLAAAELAVGPLLLEASWTAFALTARVTVPLGGDVAVSVIV